ncbi:MAG TPA: DUF4349 domain-containing protein [Trebonia sp.]|nr:DUF4349 domain-containing protein [Trebonia sp.]
MPAAVPAGGSAVYGDANGDGSSGGGGSSSGGSSSGGSASGGSASGSAAAGGSGQSATAARLAPAGQQIIYTAQLTVRAANVQDAVTQAANVATAAGGYVSTEHATSDPDHPASATATVTLKIPVAAYQDALASLSGPSVGTRLSLTQQAQDVTQQVADVASQVTSDEAAIAQLRALLRHAGSVGELLQVQNQINSDESSLEAMQAQQRALDHETTYATVTVTIVGPKAAAGKPKAKKAVPPGLASGANGGWHAFTLTIDWILAILGAVAPFAAAVAALAAAAWYLRRRLRRTPA